MTNPWYYDPRCPWCGAYADWALDGVRVCWDHLPSWLRRHLRKQGMVGR